MPIGKNIHSVALGVGDLFILAIHTTVDGVLDSPMFKEPEKGKKDVNIERMEDVLASKAEIVAVGCPFCMTMMNDGVKNFNKENEIEVLDIAEISARVNGL